MTNELEVCDTCCWYSDGFGPGKPDWCYLHEYEVVRGGKCGKGWQASLRKEPLEGPPARKVLNGTLLTRILKADDEVNPDEVDP